MGWLAIVLLVLGTIYFSIRYAGFRRGLLYTVLGLVGLAVIAWFYDQEQTRQYTAKMRVARTLIKPSEIDISQATMGLGPFARKNTVVTNNSPYHLRDLSLKLTVRDCPTHLRLTRDCSIVGEYLAFYSVNVPSGQKRGIESYVSFPNLPPPRDNEWSWEYVIVDLVAAH